MESFQIASLKSELESLRRSQDVRKEADLRHEVAQIWVATQLVVAALTVLLFLWRLSVFSLWTLFLALLHYFPKCLARRFCHSMWCAFAFYVKMKMTQARCRHGRLEGEERKAEWNACHRVLARFVYENIAELRGFWTKVGQQFSVNVLFPRPYLDELSRLQDQLPADAVEEVLATIQQEFGAATASRIKIDPVAPPLGVASIAQVHRATYYPTGGGAPRDIVVKVQHNGVEPVFKQDLFSAWIIANLIAYCDPEGVPDLRPILSTLKEVTLQELDFRLEASNQQRARKAVEDNGVNVLIPEVVSELVSKRAMAMAYVDGVRLGTVAEEWDEASRNRVIAALVDHYGVQFAVDGHFHADPHPGNLLVERSTGRLTVLDWGMCVTLEPAKVKWYARIFFAAATMNIWLLEAALKGVGIVFKEDDEANEPFLNEIIWRFILRDTQSMADATQDVQKFVQTTDSLHREGPTRYKRSPVHVLSGELLYFGKAIELLFMVSSRLGVCQPTLQAISRRAFLSLLDQKGAAAGLRPQHELFPPIPAAPNKPRSSIEQQLRALLEQKYKEGRLMGAQLCVLEVGKSRGGAIVLADLAVGVRGWFDHEAVCEGTLFNLLDISKLLIALSVLRQIDAGRLRLGDLLADHWPAFATGAASKAPTAGGEACTAKQVTVEHVLAHTSGLWRPLPPDITAMHEVVDSEKMLASVAASPPAEAPGDAQRYHCTTFGYLCAGVCRHIAGRELAEAWRETVEEACKWAPGNIRGHVAREEVLWRLPEAARAGGAAGAGLAHWQGSVSTMDVDEAGRFMARLATQVGQKDLERLTSSGREHLVATSMFAGVRADVPGALLPGMQAFGTARGVATVLGAAAAGALVSRKLAENMLRSRLPARGSGAGGGGDATSIDPLARDIGHAIDLSMFKDFGLGVQLVRPPDGPGVEGSEARAAFWGHMSQTGSMALVLPSRKGKGCKVVTLLMNMADSSMQDSCHVAWEVLKVLEGGAQQ